ncbi:MAG: methyltransferase [Peptoniphilus sp.]|nr:methyltransferase [Peptoniphilus sp.]MDD7363228.1 methyltransferase [Bacillota bacterium]MDY6044448.1 methyltransferase [Peptoniphilus sp.]
MRRDYMPRTKAAIYQEKGLFSFSIDSMLLEAYAEAEGRLLDLGCGSGYLAMAAYEAGAESVSAVDVEPAAVELLKKSAAENEMAIEVVCGDFRALSLEPFDTIWTNPPFYRRSLKNASEAVSKAKHLDADMHWFREAARLLRPGGKLYAVVDAASFQDVVCDLRGGDLALMHVRPVYWRRGEEARRILFSAKRGGGSFVHVDPPLYIYEGDHYTEEVASYYGR